MIYRGWRIERLIGAMNVGYAPARVVNAGTPASRTLNRARKVSGWLVFYPDTDDGSAKWCDTLAAAKEYIDNYIEG